MSAESGNGASGANGANGAHDTKGASGVATNGARIARVAGALVEARPMREASLYELALVGERRLMGEVIRVTDDVGTLQVYEETTGLTLGEPVALAGSTLAARLGPGLLGAVVDGVGRPLARLASEGGDFIAPGVSAPTLDPDARWRFEPTVTAGDAVRGGDVVGTVEERPGFAHRVMVPPGVEGVVARIAAGEYGPDDAVATLEDGRAIPLAQRWPVRIPRPSARRLGASRPFVTGQRVFDFLFPLAEGGSAAVPGGFGTGKTIVEQSLAKHAEADVVVYVGCGERGNEMSEVLSEFPELVDPRTGRSIMDRAVLVVNTSNMPVAAREASIYLGVTIAEFYRDMGYRVAMMVDSASRWAEALREIAARLQEMPGEEGYPTYLAARLGKFFERSGRVVALGAPEREGAVTIIGAISPPGGDFSEPVTQAALRVTGALWALDPALAHQRHYPAVDWETSYSLYAEACCEWMAQRAGRDWAALRREVGALLARERELREIAQLVGPEALEARDRLTMETAAIVRETFLRQSAFHPHDASSPPEKTRALAAACLTMHRAGLAALERGVARPDLEPARRALAALRDAPAGEVPAREAEARAAAERLAGGPVAESLREEVAA
jgi:V/A-type H+-transporting ATPase subunit A